MKISSPENTLSKVWINQFNKELGQWIHSGMSDSITFDNLILAARNLVESDINVAGFVANTLSSIIRQHVKRLLPVQLLNASETGVKAIHLISEESELKTLTLINLLNHTALSYFNLNRYKDAQLKLKIISDLFKENKFTMEVADMLESQMRSLNGNIFENLFDYEKALSEYEVILNILKNIINDKEHFGKVLISQITFDFSDPSIISNNIKIFSNLYWQQLSELRINTIKRALRCASLIGSTKHSTLLTEFLDIINHHGLGDISPLEIVAFLKPITDHEYLEEVIKQITALVKKLGLNEPSFSGILYAEFFNHQINNDIKGECQKYAEEKLIEIEDPLNKAAGFGLLFTGSDNKNVKTEYFNIFIDQLELLGKTGYKQLLQPAARVVFDEPVLHALNFICETEKDNIPWDPASRIIIAKLIDYDFAGITPLEEWIGTETGYSLLDQTLDLAKDRLARIKTALKQWPDTCVIVIRPLNNKTLFICIPGDGGSVFYEKSSIEYNKACENLTDFVDDEISSLPITHQFSPEADLVNLGKNAFNNLPLKIQQNIIESKQIFICPEQREGGASIPYELFHDGKNWLGISKIIARFPNLKSVMRCTERTNNYVLKKRMLALSVSAPNMVGISVLKSAEEDKNAVRLFFEKKGWDAPDIEENKISSTFITDRLPFIDYLHIACHGETTGSDESLLLHNGENLTGSDLLSKFFPRVPSAFINACEVGSSRWVGAGRSQSIPYSLLNSGSRVVIANLLPVEDKIASQIAMSFYKELDKNSFGESLRLVRNNLFTTGKHPLYWGTTVLFGDPSASLFQDESTLSISEQYLNALVLGINKNFLESVEGTIKLLSEIDEDSRLKASVEVLKYINRPEFIESNTSMNDLIATCRIAYEINHPALLGLIIYYVSEKIEKDYDNQGQMIFYDNAINLFESLQDYGDIWKNILEKFLVKWYKLYLGDKIPNVQVHGQDATEGDDLSKIGQTIFDIQFAIQAKEIRLGRGPIIKSNEGSIEDILRNAIVKGREFSLEDMIGHYQYAKIISDKLLKQNAFNPNNVDYSSFGMAGLLYWLWTSQNLANLANEIIEGHVGVLNEFIKTLQETWNDKKWVKLLIEYDKNIISSLKSLENLPYDDKLYPAITKVMKEIEEKGIFVIESIRKEFTSNLPEFVVCLMGLLIKNNTYSWVEGSVPEDLQKELTKILNSFNVKAESLIYPWLMDGFKTVREEKYDELKRWKYGLPVS